MLVHTPVKLRSAEIDLATEGGSHPSGLTKYFMAQPLLMYDFTLQKTIKTNYNQHN